MSYLRANLCRLFLCLSLGMGMARAGTITWSGSTNTTWSTGTNWSGGTAPGSGDTAVFSANTGNDPKITTNTTVGALSFLSGTDAEAFTVTNPAVLTIAGLSGVGITNTSGANHTFAPPVAIGSTTLPASALGSSKSSTAFKPPEKDAWYTGVEISTASAAATQARYAYLPPQFAASVLAASKLLGPGESETIEFTAPGLPGKYDFVCSFPGHAQAGMKGTLTVF